jgi:membrane protease subunit HflK
MAEENNIKPVKKHKISAFGIIFTILIIVIISLCVTSFFVVDETEQAVITRFGKYYKTLGPGLQFKLPLGIDKAYTVQTKTIQTEQFGFTTVKEGQQNKYINGITKESTMLTGDLNIVDVEWAIQYRIVDPVSWLFNVKEKKQTIRDISQSVLNSLVGDKAILDIMTSERSNIQQNAVDMMNQNFENLGLGILVNAVQLQNVVPPKGVQDAFEDVNKAEQDKNRLINEGKEAYNNEIPKTQGEADQQVLIAQGYATERINKAKGDVARFNAVYDEYRKSPSVTRQRLYLETMEEIFKSKQNNTLIDKKLDNMLPVKNLSSSSKEAQ